MDIDAPEALAVVASDPELLPLTDSVFGRPTRPGSHRLYAVDEPIKSQKFSDPVAAKGTKAALIEIRSDGTQTMIPPSMHPSGERVAWERDGEPGRVAAADLQRAVALVAVAALLVRYLPAVGVRHEFYLALAGALLSGGIAEELVERLIEVVAIVTKSTSVRSHVAAVRDTRRKMDAGEAVTGWSKVAELLGEQGGVLVKTFQKWLDVRPAFGKNTPWNKIIAEATMDEEHFAQDAGGLLHVFRGGVYRPDGLEVVQVLVQRLLNTWGQPKQWSSHRAKEVAEYIRVLSPKLLTRPPLDTLNLTNGLYHIPSGVLRPHDPAFLSPVQLGVAYDVTATCPEWEARVKDWFPADALNLAWEVIGWLMRPDTNHKKAALLLGEGDTGKSTYARAVKVVLGGDRNVSAVTLHKLEADRFAPAQLVGKLANICPDLPSMRLVNTSTFKAITGGDTIQVERKFAHPFETELYARMLFSTNHVPQTPDTTDAFLNRWIVVPFLGGFARTKSRHVLDERLAHPTELSGVLNMALAALPRLAEKGFSTSPSTDAALDEFRQAMDPLSIWLDRYTRPAPDGETPCREVLVAFNAYLEKRRMPYVTAHFLTKALKRLRPNVDQAERKVGDVRVTCYVGIVVTVAEY